MTDQFLEWLRRDRNYSQNTVAAYRRVLATINDPETATQDEVEDWWLDRDHLSPATRRQELAALRSFYRWMIRWDHRDDDPTRRLDAPKMGHRLPRPMGREDLHRLLAVTSGDMRRAICLGAYAGLRVAEVAALDWADVDVEARRIIVRGGKGDKDRPVGLSPLLLDALLPVTGGNVVRGYGNRPYSANALQQKVNATIRAAGVDGTFHKLRSRFATVALASTGNLLAVSRALGHSSPATTAIYAATADSDLDLIAEAVAR
jgi:integrase/recombinase XerD